MNLRFHRVLPTLSIEFLREAFENVCHWHDPSVDLTQRVITNRLHSQQEHAQDLMPLRDALGLIVSQTEAEPTLSGKEATLASQKEATLESQKDAQTRGRLAKPGGG